MKKSIFNLMPLFILLAMFGTSSFAGGLYISEFGHPLQGASNAGAGAIAQDASTAFPSTTGWIRSRSAS